MMRCLVAWFGLLWVMAAAALAGDWPAFRGPEGNGVSQNGRAETRVRAGGAETSGERLVVAPEPVQGCASRKNVLLEPSGHVT
jgi:hypothetical protein